MGYFLDVFLFPQEDLILNSTVLMWPWKINPIFDENDEVNVFFQQEILYLDFDILSTVFNFHTCLPSTFKKLLHVSM